MLLRVESESVSRNFHKLDTSAGHFLKLKYFEIKFHKFVTLMEFSLNGAKLSVNSGNSENLRNH